MTAALACIGLAAACGPPEPPPSIVAIVVDTLRPDHLGVYGYDESPTSPNLDARAADAAVFERAFSTSSWTLPAFGSLFTGQLPTRHAAGVKIGSLDEARATDVIGELVSHSDTAFLRLDAGLPTLATELRGRGYRTAAIVNNAFLSPEFGVDRGFDHYEYASQDTERVAAVSTDLALQWLAQHDEENPGAPFFLLVHYFDPHMPYAAPAPFLGKFSADLTDGDLSVPLGDDIVRLRNLIGDRGAGWERYMALQTAYYDEEIAYADHEIERLLAALDGRGFADDGYVFLTSDHGEEFYDHGGTEHGHTMYDELIRVPFMIWGPGIEPGRYGVPVSLVDVMPTLLELSGTPAPTSFEGVSLWQVLSEGPASRTESALRFDRPLLAERVLYRDEKKTLIRWPSKVLADIDDDAQLLFDLDADPGEIDGRALERLDEAGRDRLLRLLAELQAKISAADTGSVGVGASLSEETLRTLRNLGYIR